jgi:hypothetical protein
MVRLNPVLPAALIFHVRAGTLILAFVLSMAAPAAAQQWTEYVNIEDGFKILFMGQPTVTETTWEGEFDYTLPARVYSTERTGERYSVTVVDYTVMERLGTKRAETCPAGAETCTGGAFQGPGYWMHAIRGAQIYAAATFFKRDATLTDYLWNHQDHVDGAQIQLLNNADQSRTFAFIAMREMKLYIVEGTVAKGRPAPGLFQGALGWVDEEGNGIRYNTLYSISSRPQWPESQHPPDGHPGTVQSPGATGTVTRNSVRPGRDFTVMSLPFRRTSLSKMSRPRPVPLTLPPETDPVRNERRQ